MRALLFSLLAFASSHKAMAERVKDIATFAGVRANQLTGYGMVVGLNGTGDDNLEYSVQSARNVATRFGLALPAGINPGLKNAAVVMLTAELPSFAKPGQRLDVTVSSFGKAKSLRGGILLLAPLLGADGQIYAMAQGSLIVGGLGAEGLDGSKITINIPSAGRIPDGATIEQSVRTNFASAPFLTLNLREADFTTARLVADSITKTLGLKAEMLDSVSIQINAPEGNDARVRLLSQIENIDITSPVPAARVIINSRSGTIVITGSVRVMPAAVSHGKLTVRITETLGVSQPPPLSGGQTKVTTASDIDIKEEPGRMFLFNPGVSLNDLVATINKIGIAPGDLVAILEGLKQAGALKAELIVI